MKIIGHLIGFAIASFAIGALFHWYQTLWMPRLEWNFFSQSLPVGMLMSVISAITSSKSPVGRIIFPVFGILFLSSAVVQVLVWLSIAPHPNF